MNKKAIFRIKTALILSAVILPLFILSTCKKEVARKKSLLTVQSVFGEVRVRSEGQVKNPGVGDEILKSSTITTGKKSIIDIRYGNSGVLRINENSNLTVTELFSEKGSNKTKLDMKGGKVFVTMSKLTKGSSFRVKTPTAIAAVRGTSFRVSASDTKSRIDVISGKIKVNPVKKGVVIEKVERIVEPNKAVELDIKTVAKVEKDANAIKVVALKKEVIEEIREEVKNIKIDKKMDIEVENEIKEAGIEVKVVSDVFNKAEEKAIMDERKGSEDADKQDELAEKEKEKLEKEARLKQAENERIKNNKLEQARIGKENRERKLMEQKRLEKERIEKLRLEKERLERERIKKETKRREGRVKNIPNL